MSQEHKSRELNEYRKLFIKVGFRINFVMCEMFLTL